MTARTVQSMAEFAVRFGSRRLLIVWVSLRTQYVDAGLRNVSLSNFHGVAVRNVTIYGKYFPTHTGSKPPPPKRARSRSANLHPLLSEIVKHHRHVDSSRILKLIILLS